MKKGFLVGLAIGFLMFGMFEMASAGVIIYDNRASFEALGTIEENYGFDDWASGFSYPGDPYTAHGVTYTSPHNLVIGNANSWYTTNNSPMIANDYFNPIKGDIDSSKKYNLFGFDSGYMYKDDQGTVITITTSLNTYTFNVDLPIASSALFYGFQATGVDEYFKTFVITTTYSDSLPGMDNVTLGYQSNSPVPAPSAILLLGSGILGLAGVSRRKK